MCVDVYLHFQSKNKNQKNNETGRNYQLHKYHFLTFEYMDDFREVINDQLELGIDDRIIDEIITGYSFARKMMDY